MPKTLIQNVVQQLEHERARLRTELHKVSAALTAFGKVYLSGGKPAKTKRRTISAAGRKRIAAAQRARWAKLKAKQEKS